MGCEMAKLYNLEVHLENELAVYQPRDTVAGHVLVQVGEDTTIHSCVVWAYGNAETNWTEEDKSEGIDGEEIAGHQCFFQTSIDLLQEYNDKAGNAPNEYVITQGLHLFDFEFVLPPNLPSSFQVISSYGAKASINYSLRAEIENRSFGVSHSRERGIILSHPLDLMPHSQLRDRVTLRKEFGVSTCCTQKTGLMCEMSVNKTGFVPGETLRVEIYVNNTSNKSIQSVHLTFQQNVMMRAKDMHRRAIFLVFSVKLGHVMAQGIGHFHDSIHIPPLAPSGLAGCDIIEVDYVVATHLRLSGSKASDPSLEMEIPIIIGTDPLRETSFQEATEVVPCYASFNYATGEVMEYDPERDKCECLRPAYRYYKPRAFLLSPCPTNQTSSPRHLDYLVGKSYRRDLNHQRQLCHSSSKTPMLKHQDSVNGAGYYLSEEIEDVEDDDVSYSTWQSA